MHSGFPFQETPRFGYAILSDVLCFADLPQEESGFGGVLIFSHVELRDFEIMCARFIDRL